MRHGNQISFKYLSYSFSNMYSQVERRPGAITIVNPFKTLINEGFFYLLTYNGKKVVTYRIDRMKEVRELPTPREFEKEFRESGQYGELHKARFFSMFGGQREKK